MSFTARQLHCLDAMGIVAWTSDNRSVADSLPTPQASVPDVVGVSDAVSVSQVVKPSTAEILPDAVMPLAVDQLADWLVTQPLIPLTYKGREGSFIGSENAALMVVCLQLGESDQLPLSRESAQLFDLMMRAIDVPRTGFRQCAMQTKSPTPDNANDTVGLAYLEDIFTPHTRAVLVLDPFVNPESDASQANTAPLPSSSVPIWRIPHPDLLLKTPSLKRQAWNTLKALRLVNDNHAR